MAAASMWTRAKRVLAYVTRGADANLQSYAVGVPSPQNALDIFANDWTSSLPAPFDHLRAGTMPLFADPRLKWALEQVGGVAGRRVLELGPLEGGHTWMLEQAGAEEVTSVEANRRAYLKCLVVKELLGLRRAAFLHGDFVDYLKDDAGTWDFGVASGVLYHMQNPVELIALLARRCPAIFVWTMYYDEALVRANARCAGRFKGSERAEYEGFPHTLHAFAYGRSRVFTSFCGGSAPFAHWLTRDDILGACRHFGFRRVVTAFEEPRHANGPSVAFVAVRS